MKRKILMAAVDQAGVRRGRLCQFNPVKQRLDMAFLKSLRRFDFRRARAGAVFGDDINFLAVVVAPEIQAAGESVMMDVFHEFGYGKGFKHGAFVIMRFKLFGGVDAQKVAHKACIVKVNFGALDQALVEIFMVRRQAEDDVAGFEYRKPFVDRVVGDTAFVGNGQCVKDSRCAPGQDFKKSEEFVIMHNIFQSADILFQVSGQIRLVKRTGPDIMVIDAGIAAGSDESGQGGRKFPAADQFIGAKGQKSGHTDTAGQRLRNVFHEQIVLASGQDKTAGLPSFINRGLQVRKHFRYALDFVKDGLFRVAGQKRARVFRGKPADIRVFKRYVGVIFKQMFSQGSFPGLAGAQNGHGRKFFGQGLNFCGYGA